MSAVLRICARENTLRVAASRRADLAARFGNFHSLMKSRAPREVVQNRHRRGRSGGAEVRAGKLSTHITENESVHEFAAASGIRLAIR